MMTEPFVPRVTFTQVSDARLFFDMLNQKYAFNPPASPADLNNLLDLLVAVHAELKRLEAQESAPLTD